jgi:heme-degrading monooxygenase HmoA
MVLQNQLICADKSLSGFKEIGDRFRSMVEQLEKDNTAGFLGMSTWISTERSSSNEYATISYLRSIEDIHQFALSPVHRDAWNWWNNNVAKGGFKELAIMHEVFEVPKKNGFEGIYINYHPTGLTATTRAVAGGKEEEKEWVVPIVDARKGVFRSSRGRMARGDELGSSNEKVALDPYAV